MPLTHAAKIRTLFYRRQSDSLVSGALERFQDKWIPVIRFENATKQRLRASRSGSTWTHAL